MSATTSSTLTWVSTMHLSDNVAGDQMRTVLTGAEMSTPVDRRIHTLRTVALPDLPAITESIT